MSDVAQFELCDTSAFHIQVADGEKGCALRRASGSLGEPKVTALPVQKLRKSILLDKRTLIRLVRARSF
ncbi:MAG: hypothetical protein C4293_02825 [Nitrospiraceae bacterium]